MGVSPITSHVLDAARGSPAQGVPITISYAPTSQAATAGQSTVIARGVTNNDGRCPALLEPSYVLNAGVYTVRFDTKTYFALHGEKSFYPFVDVAFEIDQAAPHYHIPLNLAPFSYTTYRGS
ncbi:hypothetical protein GGH19_001095 [Coemansia sp. RSA 1807]|nr:hypothetical protein LPJ62_005373 [Coemansia sp. RSA 2167]KAJ2126829.1 hypothetical protein GGH17_004914 [Coemansia sp. RSA 788]KAJ2127267.1 hypothetical protein GGF48_003340 [Coemansia sp. RSA 921]KAJ2144414.1 hypothetical protein IW142_003164 [Coemansia sp. RSA 564]KAJ2150379.1 hypothetical protein J3F82_004020 [Coemansia sp. RSA 637]KAJ2164727.1 hypothetical protein GGH15_003776 [Coemansia sp. RSA 562]KAJ2172274.1 hypothetical protein GGF45_004709 [Coemansia sp. RSA 551]KAJ2173337.1 hy